MSVLPIIVFGVLSLVFGAGLALVLPSLGVLPPEASLQAQRTDSLFRILIGIGGVVFFLVQGLIYYAAIAFRAKANDISDGPNIHGNVMLEIVWTVVPSIVVVVLSIISFLVWQDNNRPSETPNFVNGQSIDINAYAQRFAWSFEYLTNEVDQAGEPIVINSGNLYSYVGQDVELQMETRDVIHSFWVPAMRVKQDLLPGRVTSVIFSPVDVGTGWQFVSVVNPIQILTSNEEGAEVVWEVPAPAEGEFPRTYELRLVDPNVDFAQVDWVQIVAPDGTEGWVRRADVQGRYNTYRLNCTELCGGGHGDMFTNMVVFENEEAYLKGWFTPTVTLLSVPPDSPIALGEQVLSAYSCNGCHTLDALGWASGSGPSLNGIADRVGGRVAEIDGVANGAEYISQSIRQPQHYLAPGAWSVNMPIFGTSQMAQEDLIGIVAYLCAQTESGDVTASTCGLSNWQFEGDSVVDVNALVEELTIITDEYQQ